MLIEIRSDRNHWVGSLGPVLVLFWLNDIQPRVCRQLPEIARELSRKQPDRRIAVLSIAGPATRPPGPEARQALASLLRGTHATIARVGVVREGGGFIISTVLSIVTGIRLLANPSSPHVFFTELEEALHWVARGLDVGQVDVDELRAAIDHRQRALTTATTASPEQVARA